MTAAQEKYKKSLIQKIQVSIRTVWMGKARDKSEETLLSFVSRISKYRLQRLEDLIKGKATKVIVALEKV